MDAVRCMMPSAGSAAQREGGELRPFVGLRHGSKYLPSDETILLSLSSHKTVAELSLKPDSISGIDDLATSHRNLNFLGSTPPAQARTDNHSHTFKSTTLQLIPTALRIA